MRNKANRQIYFDEYVKINGINQYLFHSGTKYDNPVILFLHGGPGSVESLFAHVYQERWEEQFTVVHWDQRGAGKTLKTNPDKYPTMSLMIQDLFEVIQYLKNKYKKHKIILLGHSWGSIFGSMFLKQYPEEIEYFICASPIISLYENFRVGYEKVKELIIDANDVKSLKVLEGLGDYPGGRIRLDSKFLKKAMKVRKLQGKYNLVPKNDFYKWINGFKSPIFKLSDIPSFLKGMKANQKLIEFLESIDIASEMIEYKVPIYYILGENDWQAPSVIAKENFSKINAPLKKLFTISNAGHMIFLEQPKYSFDILLEIHKTAL